MQPLANSEQPEAVTLPAAGPRLVEPVEKSMYEGDGLDFTDVDNAERLVRRHGKDIRYCSQWKCWLIWDGKRWLKDDAGKIIELAKEIAKQIRFTAATICDPDRAKQWFNFAIRSQSRDRINAMITMAQPIQRVVVHSDEWDTDPALLNCLSGVIDLRTGEQKPHDRSRLITKLASVKYDPNLKPARWLEFLSLAMMRSGSQKAQKALIEYLQRCVGYTLTAWTRETAIFIPYGSGNNGKSIFTWAMDRILGDYACSAEPETLMARNRNGGGPSGDVARLKGARLVRAAESEQGHRLNESMLKRMTGGERIVASFKYGNEFEYLPTFKIWMATNHKPVVRGTDFGIWRRLKLIPFEVNIPEAAKALGKPEKNREEVYAELSAEMPGILAWAVEGARLWHQSGLQEPAEVTNATNEYRQEMDALANFISECCVVQDGIKTLKQSLYAAYKRWCEDNNEMPLNDRNFGVRLGEKGFKEKSLDGKGRTQYHRIGLVVEPNLRDDVPDKRQSTFDDDVPFQ